MPAAKSAKPTAMDIAGLSQREAVLGKGRRHRADDGHEEASLAERLTDHLGPGSPIVH
jgi:hypothetical protein